VSRWERTGQRDLAFSQWHRHALPDDCTAIDIDFVEYCRRCKQPIALVESARDMSGNGYYKPAMVTHGLAVMAGIRAYTVLWKPVPGRVTPEHGLGFIERARVARVAPDPTEVTSWSERELVRWFRWLHRQHQCTP
jgi:hypothetical protein